MLTPPAAASHTMPPSADEKEAQRQYYTAVRTELESALGAALQSEMCHMFDELSNTHHLVCLQGTIAPPSPAPEAAADVGGAGRDQQGSFAARLSGGASGALSECARRPTSS